jgi:hypothetical protein
VSLVDGAGGGHWLARDGSTNVVGCCRHGWLSTSRWRCVFSARATKSSLGCGLRIYVRNGGRVRRGRSGEHTLAREVFRSVEAGAAGPSWLPRRGLVAYRCRHRGRPAWRIPYDSPSPWSSNCPTVPEQGRRRAGAPLGRGTVRSPAFAEPWVQCSAVLKRTGLFDTVFGMIAGMRCSLAGVAESDQASICRFVPTGQAHDDHDHGTEVSLRQQLRDRGGMLRS